MFATITGLERHLISKNHLQYSKKENVRAFFRKNFTLNYKICSELYNQPVYWQYSSICRCLEGFLNNATNCSKHFGVGLNPKNTKYVTMIWWCNNQAFSISRKQSECLNRVTDRHENISLTQINLMAVVSATGRPNCNCLFYIIDSTNM